MQLVKHSFGSGDDPTWKHDVSLLSLELYRRGHDSHVLVVPRVVPVLHGAQRRVDVNVRVLDSHDDEVEVEIRAEQGVASAKPVRSEDEFLSLKLPQSARAVREILTAIRAASIPGMDETRYVSGQPTFRIRGYSVLTVSPGQKALASNIQKAYLKGSDAGDPLASAAEAFQKRLKAIEGSTSTSTGRVLIPPEKALRNVEAIVDALQRLAEALSTVEPGTAQDES